MSIAFLLCDSQKSVPMLSILWTSLVWQKQKNGSLWQSSIVESRKLSSNSNHKSVLIVVLFVKSSIHTSCNPLNHKHNCNWWLCDTNFCSSSTCNVTFMLRNNHFICMFVSHDELNITFKLLTERRFWSKQNEKVSINFNKVNKNTKCIIIIYFPLFSTKQKLRP